MYSVTDAVAGLNEMAADLHKVSSEHGFWEGKEVKVNGAGIGVWAERELPEALMLIVSETAEALDDYRDGHDEDETWYEWDLPKDFPFQVTPAKTGGGFFVKTPFGGLEELSREQFLNLLRIHNVPLKPCGIPSELADVIVRVLDVCGKYGIDIEKILKEKIEYNRQRAFKHGRVH